MSDAGPQRLADSIWYGGSALSLLLQPVAALYGLAMRVRAAAYRRAWSRTVRLPVPVVVVGNITAGGTGKTPVVEWLALQLRGAGFHPGIVSRGYGSRAAGRGEQPRLAGADSDPAEVGDEPLLLARRTGLPVLVCRDRVAAAQAAIARGADVVVSDDGLQHYRLGRDMEIAVVDGLRGLGNGRMLPAGPLREPVGRLATVDLVLVQGGAMAAAITFILAGQQAVALHGEEVRTLGDFAGRRVWAVAGIGNPDRFYAGLRAAGMDPWPVPVPDHGVTDLVALRARSDWPILMTEKDAVKYPACVVTDAWYVPVTLQMRPEAERAVMDRVLARIRRGVS